MGVEPPGGNSMWNLNVFALTVHTDLVQLKIHRLAQMIGAHLFFRSSHCLYLQLHQKCMKILGFRHLFSHYLWFHSHKKLYLKKNNYPGDKSTRGLLSLGFMKTRKNGDKSATSIAWNSFFFVSRFFLFVRFF